MLHTKSSLLLMIPQKTMNLFTYTKEIFHGKHHLMCNENILRFSQFFYIEILAKSRSIKTYGGNDLFIPEIN